MTEFWNWLSGKKTIIGATLLLASAFATQVVIGIWDFDPDWMPRMVETLDWIGGVITAGGLVHKAAKTKPVAPLFS